MHKNSKNHLRRNNYEVRTAVALHFRNILGVMKFEYINLSEDKIGCPPFWCNEKDLHSCHQLAI